MTSKHGRYSNQSHKSGSRQGSTGNPGVQPESYVDDTGTLRPELVDEEAIAEARRCENVSETQMRRFFGAAKAELMGVKSDNQARVAVALLKAKAYYAAARNKKNNQSLADFFGHHAGKVRTTDDFRHFIRHFEAVIAYHKFDKKG